MSSRILTAPAGPFRGVGLHSGRHSRMVIHPAAPGSGIVFHRRHCGRDVSIPARLDRVVPGRRRTVLAQGRVTVSTVEHALAALNGLNIHDAAVWLDGPEVPIMDGSAAPFARALLRASEPASVGPVPWTVGRSVHVVDGAAACHLLPGRRLEIWCQVEFSKLAGRAGSGRQSLRHEVRGPEAFIRRLAPARTFGFLDEATQLRRAGLARGASLSNVLVFHEAGVLNPGGTRFIDEPVRHKVLDALGDLALLGATLRGKIKLVHCSHRLLTSTLRDAIQKGMLVRS